jgi:hypothetical protein
MARFLSREEWPLVAAGVLAGVLTSALLIYLFIAALRGGPGIDPALVGEADPATDPAVRPAPAPGPGRGVIGVREAGVRARLAAHPVDARPLRGPISIDMRNVVWHAADAARFARADRVRGNLDPVAAQRGDVILSNVVLTRPAVTLRQARVGEPWNFEQVFAELLEPAAVPPPRVRTVQVRGVQVVDGHVDVTMPDRRFAFESVQGQLPLVVFSQPGVAEPYLRAAVVTATFVQPEPEPARLAITLRDGGFEFPQGGRVRFDVAAATLDRTQLAEVRGVWDPADAGFGITAEGRAVVVHLEDVGFLLPEAFPETGTTSFAFSVRPLPGDRTEATLTGLDARTGQSRITGGLTAAFGEEFFVLRAADLRLDPLELALVEGFTGPLPLGGALRGRVVGTDGDMRFDLIASLTAPAVPTPFTVDIAGRALLFDDGFALQRADLTFTRLPLAAVRAVAPALPLDGAVTGRVTLTGLPTQAPLALDVRLEVGAGVALVQGTLDLTGAVPAFDLAGDVIGIDLPAFLAVDVPPVAFTGSFALAGSGADLERLTASIRAAGRFTGWQATPQDTLIFVGALNEGTLHVQQFLANLATARLAADGVWRFIEPQAGSIGYTVAVAALEPFGPYLPLVGDAVAAGALSARGTVGGTLARMRLIGRLTVADLRVGEWQAQVVEAQHDIAFGGDLLPVAIVEATTREVSTPTLGAFRTADLNLHMTPPDFRLDISALRTDGGLVEVAADGVLPEVGPRIVVVRRGRFDLDIGSWVLLQPATVTWLDDEVTVAGLILVEPAREGRLALEGRILPLTQLDANFEIAALPTGDLLRLLGQAERVQGTLWAEGIVSGEAADPVVAIDFRMEDGVFDGVPLQQLEGRLAYAQQLTQVTAAATAEPGGWLRLQAQLPSVIDLGGDPVFALLDGLPLSGTLTATDFSLAPLAAAAPAQVQDIRGVINAHATLTGTANEPVVAGSASLAGGAMTIADLNQRWDQVSGVAEFDGGRLIIADLRARSAGWVVASGHVVLERLDNPVLDLNVVFDGFRPIGVENQRDAAVFGTLALTGPPRAVELTGRLHVDDGYLVIPQFGGPGAELVDITRPPPVLGRPLEAIEDGGAIEALTIRNLVVSFGDAAWFMADEARAQLAGELIVNKVGNATPVTGTLTGTRGQYTLIAGPIVRRFDVVSAQVRFMGAPTPNPSIDITARRVVFDPAGRPIEVDVRVTGTLETPRLSLAGGDATGVAESELLSFLLFGRPTFALGGQFLLGEDVLEQTLWGGLAEVLAIELERGLGGLGLDVFQIRLGAGPMGGLRTPTVVLGRQLRPDVFLTVETGITALLGGAGAGGGDNAPLHWAVRLDWTFDRQSRARLAWEPVYGGRAFRGAALALPLRDPYQQFLIELRRRWTY